MAAPHPRVDIAKLEKDLMPEFLRKPNGAGGRENTRDEPVSVYAPAPVPTGDPMEDTVERTMNDLKSRVEIWLRDGDELLAMIRAYRDVAHSIDALCASLDQRVVSGVALMREPDISQALPSLGNAVDGVADYVSEGGRS